MYNTPLYACEGIHCIDGLSKAGKPDNTQTRGKIAKIGYLLEVTEVE